MFCLTYLSSVCHGVSFVKNNDLEGGTWLTAVCVCMCVETFEHDEDGMYTSEEWRSTQEMKDNYNYFFYENLMQQKI